MIQTDWLVEPARGKQNNLYSKLSIVVFLISSSLITYAFVTAPVWFAAKNRGNRAVVAVIAAGMVVSCIAGAMLSIASVIKHEKPVYLKITGVILNWLLLLLMIAAYVFAKMMDSRK